MQYTEFTPQMKYTHKLLVPQMSPIHFEIMAHVLRAEGYDVELLKSEGSEIRDTGQRYVHNDACYPATLVIGQLIAALKSGKYDEDKVALVMSQTGGGCRASNYLSMLRKALYRAGYAHIPVASLNFSGLEKNSALPMSFRCFINLLLSVLFGDELMCLESQVSPFEKLKGASSEVVKTWIDRIGQLLRKRPKLPVGLLLKRISYQIAADFAKIETDKKDAPKVGVVGEIYVKYAPAGNNHLVSFLQEQGCEVITPPMFGFVQYCVKNVPEEATLYGGHKVKGLVYNTVLKVLSRMEKIAKKQVARFSCFHVPSSFKEIVSSAKEFIGLGANMGEGWLLTGDMVDMVQSGTPNIICAQPFGCLPNHVCGKAMIAKIRQAYPQANIMPIDYDPSASQVNQENRIKLMLSYAKEAKQEENC
jgi:predicted nucleotide-binding protein (sugar kinase/HSP70/actin superfamily)